jgi:hypothetical protein
VFEIDRVGSTSSITRSPAARRERYAATSVNNLTITSVKTTPVKLQKRRDEFIVSFTSGIVSKGVIAKFSLKEGSQASEFTSPRAETSHLVSNIVPSVSRVKS